MTYKLKTNPSLVPDDSSKPTFSVVDGELRITCGDVMFTLSKDDARHLASFIDRQLVTTFMTDLLPPKKTMSPRCYALEA